MDSMNLEAGDLDELVLRRVEQINEILSQKQNQLKQAPAGELRINKTKKNTSKGVVTKVTYYLRTAAGSMNGSYMRKSQIDLVRALAQKKYDTEVSKALQQEKHVLERVSRLLRSVANKDIYGKMTEEWQTLINPIRLTDEEYARRWQAEPYEEYQQERNNRIYKTNRGEMVRSKSEKIIADMLDRYHIPYRYEEVCRLNNGREVYPDFTFLNVKRRKVFRLEHLGMMDDPKYAGRNMAKMRDYASSGYYEGENILYTFETKEVSISVDHLENLVKHYFLS